MVITRRVNLRWSDINMSDLDLIKLISHFAQSNKAEGKSPKTVDWYTEMLSDFARFIRASGRKAILAEFHSISVREFMETPAGYPPASWREESGSP